MSVNLILSQLVTSSPHSDLTALRGVIAELRPRAAGSTDQATRNLLSLLSLLESDPELSLALREYLGRVISSRKLSHLLTDTGITQSAGFWGSMWESINYKWLPPVVRDEYLKDVFSKIFDHTDDYRWVNAVDDAVWMRVIQAIGFNRHTAATLHIKMLQELLSAVQVLSYRISAIGLEAELVRNYPAIEEFESAFLRQNVELNDYISQYGKWLSDNSIEREDSRHIDVLLSQCDEVVGKIRRISALQGTSVSLTRLLLRVTQSIERLRILLSLLDERDTKDVLPVAVRLFKDLVTADNRKHNLSDLLATNTELLALQITANAGRTGEHYVANSRAEWLAMLYSASGAGAIVGFMAVLKVLVTALPLAPFGHALLYSLNYGLGFVLIYMLHFTIATKQPAMTAALMALAIDSGKQKLDELAELAVRMLRSQFIAIIGNVALVMPVAYLIAWSWNALAGHPLIDAAKAQHMLHEIDPIHGLALPYAAIAGVCLFLAGLISGYYDNKASYNDISGRLQQREFLIRLFGKERLDRIARYVGDNLGALAGNFFFGVMLGTIGTLGTFFGLPLDIRHITFSSANFAFALVGLHNQLSTSQWLLSIFGVALIGLTNLAVSFGLALSVALRSRRVNLKREWSVFDMLLRRFLSAPRDFFYPPAELAPLPIVAEIDSVNLHRPRSEEK